MEKLGNFQPLDQTLGIFEINNIFYAVGRYGITTIPPDNKFYKFPLNKRNGWCETCKYEDQILFIDDEGRGNLFNPINKQWSDTNVKTERLNFAVVYYLNKVYIVGGSDCSGWQTLNSIEVYDPVSKTQVLSPIKMNEARCCHKVIVYNNKLFVFGGIDKNERRLNSVEMFSTETNKFVMMAPMKIGRRGFACCRVGNLVYVVAGCMGYGRGNTKSVEIYNMDSNTWTDGVDFPVDKRLLHACAVNDKLELNYFVTNNYFFKCN